MNRQSRLRLVLLMFVILAVMATLPGATQTMAQGGTKSKTSTPTPKAQKRMSIDVEGGMTPKDVVKQLVALDLIPSGGTLGMQVARSAINVVGEGNWIYSIAKDTRLKNFVLQFEMRARNVEGETNGCGMVFRGIDDDNLSFVLLTKDRYLVLIQVDKGDKIVDFDQSVEDLDGIDATDYALDGDQLHIITIVAVDDTLVFFLNGLEITTETTAKAVRGSFATRVYNEPGNTQNTFCAWSNIWAWSFDR